MLQHLFRTLLTTVLASVCFVAGAGTIRGVVRDNKGQKLPFASVFVPGTTTGTAANANGEYQLSLEPGTYKLSSQLIGYKQITISVTITGNETIERNFTLPGEGLTIKEVVVKGKNEDPAYRIIRKAIAKRPDHLKQIRSFQSAIYLKGVFRTTDVPDKIFGKKVDKEDMGPGMDSMGRGVIYLCEEVADYYAQEPNKERTIIHSVRESGDANGLGLAQMPPVITFYDNNVKVMEVVAPRGLVSPIADNAISFYKYKLEGEFVENDQLIYKIRVTPRRKFEPLFEGVIYIVDDDWAIHSLSLATTAKTGIEYLDSLNISQSFLPLGKDNWVVKSQVFKPKMTLLGIGFTGHFVTVYNNQKVNEPVPDGVFNKKLVSSYDKGANKKDTTYWDNLRPIPLETDEVKDYHVKDSAAAAPKDLHREDSLRRRSNRRIGLMDVFIGGKTFRSRQGARLGIGGLLWATNYNSLEGLNIAPNFTYDRTLDTGKSLEIAGAVRYGFENRHFNAMGRVSYTQNDRAWQGRSWTAGVEGGKYVFQFNPDNPVVPILNTFSTLRYNQNYLKLYERWDANIFFKQNFGNGLSWNAGLNFQHRLPLENVSSYSWAEGSKDPMTPNVPKELVGQYWEEHNALLAHLEVSYQPGFKYIQYPDYKAGMKSGSWPRFSASYDKGISGLFDSKVNFDKWRAGINGSLGLKLFGILSYNLAAGGFLNDNTVSIPDMMHLYGNQYFLATPYLRSFQIAPYYRFSNTEKIYGEAHVEYNLYGLFTNKIPLFRSLKWYFILGNNTFYAGEKKYYTEAFLGIDNIGFKIYRLFRVDFVHSWEANGDTHTGIRIGLRMAGLVGGGGSGRNGEWKTQP